MARPILLACLLTAGAVALYTGWRSARAWVEAEPIVRSTPGAAAQQPRPTVRGVQMIVPPDRQTFLVATRLPDGRIAFSHATGEQLAEPQAPSGASSGPLTSGKETRHDR